VLSAAATEAASNLASVMTTLRPSSLRQQLRGSGRVLLKELAAFGVVGGLALVIDVGIFTWLSPHGALKAKAISTVVSTIFAYFGNRYLSFSHRARTSIGRETTTFFGINLVTLIFSELIIALFVYPLGYAHTSAVVFVVNLVTIGLGTIFRFWAYKRFVFLHPDRVRSPDIDLDEELAE
jgi:putative flippase GtrA